VDEKLKLLYSRRSIRAYTDAAVADEVILEIIKAGMAAPTARNQKPWHVTVIKDAQVRTTLGESSGAWRCCAQAPVVLLVSGDQNRFIGGEHVAMQDFWMQDCAAITQNILLAATAFDLGSLWMGVYPNHARVKSTRELLELPEHLVPFALIAIGHKGEEKEARSQYEEEQVIWK